VYKHTYAEQFYTYIALPPATGNAGVNDSDYDQTIELGDIPVYPYLKNWVAATNISNGYFMDWAIRSRAENSVSVHNKYLPSDMNDVNTWLNAQSSNDVQDWGDKTFGIDYTYFFTWPDGSQEVVTNSFDDVITIKDFDNETSSPQDIVIASIKDSLGEDLNIRKYICDSDADLVPDIDANGNEQLWLPVYAYLDIVNGGGAFSLMLSEATSTPSNIQEVNDTVSPVIVNSDLEPLLMIPQITDPTLVRNVNGWTTVGGDPGTVYFELNIKKLVEGVDYKLYAIHTLNVET
jgi:hypothetical protein